MKVKDGAGNFVKLIKKKKYVIKEIKDDMFDAYISLVDVVQVDDNIIIKRDSGEDVCILAEGYKWVQVFPKNDKYMLTAIYDENSKLIELYFDMIYESTVKDDIPYAKDLYLDLAVTPERVKYVLDEDELLEALSKKEITDDDYIMAHNTLNMLDNTYVLNEENFNKLVNRSKEYLDSLLNE